MSADARAKKPFLSEDSKFQNHQKRNDESWMTHTLGYWENGMVRLSYMLVHINTLDEEVLSSRQQQYEHQQSRMMEQLAQLTTRVTGSLSLQGGSYWKNPSQIPKYAPSTYPPQLLQQQVPSADDIQRFWEWQNTQGDDQGGNN